MPNVQKMKIYIVIPAHNEADVIERTLASLLEQTLPAKKIIVVDDNSTDQTYNKVVVLAKTHPSVSIIKNTTTDQQHLPGAKVVRAFNKAITQLDQEYDLICKFDADLIFPENYLATIAKAFNTNPKCGIAGGFCYIEKDKAWVLENLTNQDHIRGALKAYRKACFTAIGGLTPAMGWDTIDEIKAKYNAWEVITDPSLKVKHLKPTGTTYGKKSKYNQGIAFYQMRYRPLLTFLAALKLGWRKKSALYFINCCLGFGKASLQNKPFLLTKLEGKFMRRLRYKAIKNKLTKP